MTEREMLAEDVSLDLTEFLKRHPRLQKKLSFQEQTTLVDFVRQKAVEVSEHLELKIRVLQREIDRLKDLNEEQEEFFQSKEKIYHTEMDRRMHILESLKKKKEKAQNGSTASVLDIEGENQKLRAEIKEMALRMADIDSKWKTAIKDKQRIEEQKKQLEIYYTRRELVMREEVEKTISRSTMIEKQRVEAAPDHVLKKSHDEEMEQLVNEISRQKREMLEKDLALKTGQMEIKFLQKLLASVEKVHNSLPVQAKEFLSGSKVSSPHKHIHAHLGAADLKKIREDLFQRDKELSDILKKCKVQGIDQKTNDNGKATLPTDKASK
ncbi:uncharacterized protein LOC106150492 [Lingula anatina]|uniref:Uncharacterized protein LOC106150492 n=1 Tax=Lingula anatina TaxID=7574 RepID=A0A1S3GY50_LINAN|nr:uncharacterized protein LOC106150492 [Lingula anatina]|eukprot:XP_013378800.1 uncharacterized protein LOC106150492 [Lingula anatina]